MCVSGGDTLPTTIGERWRSLVGVDIVEGAGATAILTFLSNRPEEAFATARPASLFRVLTSEMLQ